MAEVDSLGKPVSERKRQLQSHMADVLRAKKEVLSLYGGGERAFKAANQHFMGEEGRREYGSRQRFKGWSAERDALKQQGFFPDDPVERAAHDRVIGMYEADGYHPRVDELRSRLNSRMRGDRDKAGPNEWRELEKDIRQNWEAGRIGDRDYSRASVRYEPPESEQKKEWGSGKYNIAKDPWNAWYTNYTSDGDSRRINYGLDDVPSFHPRDPSAAAPEHLYRSQTDPVRGRDYWKQSQDYGLDQSLPFELRASFPPDAPMPFSDAPYSSPPVPLKDVDDWAGSATPRKYKRGY